MADMRAIILAILLFVVIDASPQNQGWTVFTLKEYVDTRLEAIDKAVTKAEAATEKRFTGVNELRGALEDQQRLFMPRTETEAMFVSMNARMAVLEETINRLEAVKAGGNSTIAYVIAFVSTAVAIIMALRRWNTGIIK